METTISLAVFLGE